VVKNSNTDMYQGTDVAEMKGDVCGNCRNFKLKTGEKFYNCTRAEHAGLKYGMQVRANTRSCDAYVSASMPSGERAQPVGFPHRRRAMLLIASLIAVLLASWAIYSYATKPTETTVPITTPTPGPTATPVETPGPTATPVATPATTVNVGIGEDQWAVSPDRMVMVSSTSRMSSYILFTGRVVKAPPGTDFVFIDVTTVNLGQTALSTEADDFSLSFTESERHTYEYEPQSYKYYHVGRPYAYRELSRGGVADGRVFWIVPQTASGLEVSYLLDPNSTPPVTAVWQLSL